LRCEHLPAGQAAGWIAAIAASGAAGVGLSYALLDGVPAAASAAASLGLAAVGSGLVTSWARERARALRGLCRLCGRVVYWPRRSSYVCGWRGLILCYSYATRRYYAVKPLEGVEERLPWWRGAAFYCVRFLGGRLEERGRVRVYHGRLLSLTPRRGLVFAGEGAAAYAGVEEGVESVVDAVQG